MEDSELSGSIYKPLGPEQIEQIHLSALEILCEVGISFGPGIDPVTEKIAFKNGVKK